jgi:hypothetical protein
MRVQATSTVRAAAASVSSQGKRKKVGKSGGDGWFAAVDAVGVGDYAGLGGLPGHVRQPHPRHRLGGQQITQDLTSTDRGHLACRLRRGHRPHGAVEERVGVRREFVGQDQVQHRRLVDSTDRRESHVRSDLRLHVAYVSGTDAARGHAGPIHGTGHRCRWAGGGGGCAEGLLGRGPGLVQDGVVTTSPPVAGAARTAGAVLDAVLERITYANEETGYTIARVATDRSGTDLLTVVGSLLGVQPGESLRLVGRWGSHPRYGRQFEVDSFTTVLPATIQGIERYLGSGLIKGIGPKMAARIVEHFGADTLRVIEEEPGGWSRYRAWVPSAQR